MRINKQSAAKTVHYSLFGLVALLCISVVMYLFIVPTWAAIDIPVVTDGSSVIYEPGGSTITSESLDVYVSPTEGVSYYYLFGDAAALNSVKVIYEGLASDVNGSFFEGSQIPGEIVTTIGEGVDGIPGTLVGADNKIQVPLPLPGKPVELKILAYNGSDTSEFYRHTFYAQAKTPVLTDGASLVYADKGKTGITGSIDTFIVPEPDTEYYYTLSSLTVSASVDIYYEGDANDVEGSFFPDTAFVNGDPVKRIVTAETSIAGILVGPDNKISIPYPQAGRPAELTVTAHKDGAETSKVYTHIFAQRYDFVASLTGDGFVSELGNNSENELDASFVVAIYDKGSGKLARSENHRFTVPAGGSELHGFTIDTGEYPAENFIYKAYCWDQNYVPLVNAVELK